MTNQSFSARKRRPSGMPQSRRFLTCAVDRGLQEARIGRHHPHQMLGIAHIVDRAVERRAEPLVRVDHERVRALDALPHPAAFGQDHRAARHRGVDMQPDSVAPRDLGDRRDRIDRRRRGRADGGDDREGRSPFARSSAIISRKRVGAHGVFVVERDEPQIVAAEAGEQRAFVDRAVRVRRHIDARRARFALQAAARQRIIRRPLARADERDQRAGRGGVLDHAAPGGRKAEHLPEPVGDHLLDLRHRRARLPREPDHARARSRR